MSMQGGVENTAEMDTSAPATTSTVTISGAPVNEQRVRQMLRRVFALRDGVDCRIAAGLDSLDAHVLHDAGDMGDAVQSLCLDVVDQLLGQQHCPGVELVDVASASAVLNVAELDRLVGSGELCAFVYLLRCLQRVSTEENNNWVAAFEAHTQLLQRVSSVLLDCVCALLQGAFSADSITSSGIGSLLLRAVLLDLTPDGFLESLVMHAEKTAQLHCIVQPALDSVCRAAARQSFESAAGVHEPYRMVARALRTLCAVREPNSKPPRRPVCTLLVQRADWLPPAVSAAAGRELASLSFLGPIFAISLLNDKIMVGNYAAKFFPAEDVEAPTRELLYKSIRERLAHVRLDCHAIVREVLGNAGSRRGALDWLQAVAGRNSKKTQMHADETKLASDGFMLNALGVMYDLARPVTLDKVQPLYPFHKDARVDLAHDARLKFNPEQLADFINALDSSFEVKFPTECFFLTVHMQHAALVPALNRQHNLRNALADYKKRLAEAERTASDESESAARRQRYAARARQYKDRIGFVNRILWCGEAALMDDGLMAGALQFCAKQIGFLVSTLSPKYGIDSDSLSLPDKPTDVFAALPECYLEDVLDLLLHLIKYTPSVLMHSCPVDLLQHLLVFIVHPDYFNNPFLAAKCVELLFYFTPAVQPSAASLFNSMLNHHVATERLFPSLITFYSACESTGSHTEFFDKFSIRHNIQVIFSTLRQNALYRHLMIEHARRCDVHFTRFVNMLINDTTFLLDETVENLKNIKQTEMDMADTETWNQQSREDIDMRTGRMQQDAASVRSWLSLAHNTLAMFEYMTDDAPEPFLSAVLGERLAAMLNYNLAALCGPKCSGLKVNNPQKYNWDPRRLLAQIVEIYLHLDSPQFVNYISADERSYSEAMLANALDRMTRFSLVPISHIERLRHIAERAARAWRQREQEDECLSEDAPPEYFDPIMGTLMVNPVRLPSSHIVDRKVIERHLLSTPLNPFTREPMSIDDVTPDEQLREQIQRWKQNKLAQRAALS